MQELKTLVLLPLILLIPLNETLVTRRGIENLGFGCVLLATGLEAPLNKALP